MTKTTKDDLQAQVAKLTAAVNGLPEHRVLKVCMDHTISTDYSRYNRVDMKHVDYAREEAKRRLAHMLADELIRSGAVQVTETLEDDHMRFGKTLRTVASLRVC